MGQPISGQHPRSDLCFTVDNLTVTYYSEVKCAVCSVHCIVYSEVFVQSKVCSDA